MIVAHNLVGDFAHRALKHVNEKNTKGISKLSSGMRINRAADDAAGLSISEKMRSQIRGLSQATRNIQDGISLVQTAESGLNEVTSILQRMRQISVQAANGTLSDGDRDAIQNEIIEMKDHINKIAEQTQFNGITLLNSEGIPKITQVNPKEIDILVGAGQIVKAGVIEIPNPPDPSDLWIEGKFGTISGAEWPDINIKSPSGEWFGYATNYLNSTGYSEDTTNNSSSKATYTGWSSQTERVTFENPISGKWLIEIRNIGGTETSTFKITSNYPLDIQYIMEEVVADNREKIDLQVGPDAEDVFTVKLTNATTKGLQIDGVAAKPRERAEQAIGEIENAIRRVSKERSKFGAYQNKLEYTYNNLSNYEENLRASESRIRDADIAKEMVDLTKNNIIQQAATAMLAQAKQSPQAVLQLLR